MKKTSLYILIFSTVILLHSCEIKDCAYCRVVVEDSNGTIEKDDDTPVEYCDEELNIKESEEPFTLEGKTSYWLCE